jgi:hypothetical protein
VIEPRKEGVEADAVREGGRQHQPQGDSTGVTEQGTRATGFPGSWEISPTPTSDGTASAKETKRGRGRREVRALCSSDESGELEPLGPRGAKRVHDAWALKETDAIGLRATNASELDP